MYCSTQGWVMCYYTNQPLGGVWCHQQNLSASSLWWEQVRPHLKWCLYILEYTVIVVHSLEKTFDMLNLVILTVYPIKLQLHSLNRTEPKQQTSFSMSCRIRFSYRQPSTDPVRLLWILTGWTTGALLTHLVQAHECVESFSCCHRHLCVVFLQDQHVKHQLEAQTMKNTENHYEAKVRIRFKHGFYSSQHIDM